MKADASLVALRDELYALLKLCLEKPDRAEVFDLIADDVALKPEYAPHQSYLRDRSNRYCAALKEWNSAKQPKDQLARDLALAQVLFNHGLFFDTHEYLEGAWNRETGAKKLCLQGLIQLGAGLHKLELDSQATGGAVELLEKGIAKLQETRSVLGTKTVSKLVKELTPVLALLRAGKFRFADVPKLRWTPGLTPRH